MDVQEQVPAGEEAEVVTSQIKEVAVEVEVEVVHLLEPVVMEIDTEAEHVVQAAEAAFAEVAEDEQITELAAKVEIVEEVEAAKVQEPATDFGFYVKDMYTKEHRREDREISLNTVRVEDMCAEQLVDFYAQMREEKDAAITGIKSSTPRPMKKRKRLLKLADLPHTSSTVPPSQTSSLQILTSPPK